MRQNISIKDLKIEKEQKKEWNELYRYENKKKRKKKGSEEKFKKKHFWITQTFEILKSKHNWKYKFKELKLSEKKTKKNNYLVFLTNTPAQAESLQYRQEQAARSIDLYINSNATNSMSLNQDDALSPHLMANLWNYLTSSISSKAISHLLKWC